MATAQSFLNNFPVKFQNESDSCLECDGRDFCQLAEWGDRFEFAFEPSTTDVAVTNGTFTGSLTGWTAGSGWTYNSNKARLTNNTGWLEQNISHIVGRKYKISVTISNYSGSGGLNIGLGLVYVTAYIPAGLEANGTYTAYITPTSAAGVGDLQFGTTGTSGDPSSATLDIDDVTVELVNEDCGIELYNTVTGTYSGIRKYANLTSPYIATLGYSYLWSDMGVLYDGCYKIVVYDLQEGSNLVTNGTFTGSLTGWTAVNVVWSGFFGGTASFGTDSSLEQSTASYDNGTYTLSFTIYSYVTGTLEVIWDGVVIAEITANGTYTYQFEYSSIDPTLEFSITGAGNLRLDDVSLTLHGCAESELSECYKIAEQHECTKMLKWTNESTNGFNYPYYYFYNAANSYGFQWMRVESDLRNAKYPGNAEKYIDSGGNNILYYGNVRKLKDFVVAMMPEYMHDALANGFKHKAFYIDDVRYTFEDTDYTPEWSSDIPTVLAESTSLVGKYNQDNSSID